MNLFRKIIERLQEQLRIVITNPDNFEVKWTITSSRFRLYSVVVVIIIISGFILSYLISSINSNIESKSDASIERKKLEVQFRKISSLSKELKLQSTYIERAKKVISGEIAIDSFSKHVPDNQDDLLSSLSGDLSENEKNIEKKVNEDYSAIDTKQNIKKIIRFVSPINGKIISKFKFQKHPYIQIEVAENEKVASCGSGVVLLSGMTKSEGAFVIIKHYNGFLSIYKNLSTFSKKYLSKVKKGEVVGSIGKNNTVQNLHFELWYNEYPVNPEEYIKW